MPISDCRKRGLTAAQALRVGLLALSFPLGAGLLAALHLMLGFAIAANPETQFAPQRDGMPEGQIIFPPDKSVLMSGSIDIIVKFPGGKPVVDGKPCACKPFKNPLYVKRVRLSPGRHSLQVGDRRAEFVVALNELEHDGPSDWKIYKSHLIEPGDDRCGVCHETEENGGAIHLAGTPPDAACLDCHTEVDFGVIHAHPLQPLEDCQLCHVMHGSPHNSLLKAPPKQLCDKCHES